MHASSIRVLYELSRRPEARDRHRAADANLGNCASSFAARFEFLLTSNAEETRQSSGHARLPASQIDTRQGGRRTPRTPRQSHSCSSPPSSLSSSIYPHSEGIKFAALDIRPARVRAASTHGTFVCAPIVDVIGRTWRSDLPPP